MKPKDFAKYRKQQPEGSSSGLGMCYGMSLERSADSLLAIVPMEDRPTVEEAERLFREFNENFPTVAAQVNLIRDKALSEMLEKRNVKE